MKNLLVILRRNFISPIVIAILILAGILLYLNQTRDAWFLSVVVIVNTLIAVVQEVRAQRALRKLELMSAPHAHLINSDGSITDIQIDQLKVGDNVRLGLGDEIPADGVLIESAGLEADESILTGESVPVGKKQGAFVYAASAVVGGSAVLRVDFVGHNTKIGSMSKTLKNYQPQLTPIQIAIQQAITWLTYGALGLAILIIVIYSLSGENAIQIFKTVTSAAVTVVPEGLLLASSVLLAFGSIKLAQAKVLPQKLAAIEAMALLNVLCVDKTGTLTSDQITFEGFELFDESEKDAAELIGVITTETGSGSKTNAVIAAQYPAPLNYKLLETLAFSSERKYSGVKVKIDNKTYSALAGSPEFLSKLSPLSAEQNKKINDLAMIGKRVLLLSIFDDTDVNLSELQLSSGRSIGIMILANELRVGVEKTVAYLQNNGVSIKVISGDNPATVQYIATKAGIHNSQNVITGAELKNVSKKHWNEVVSKNTIFATVLPDQKEKLVATFKELGHFTGMVGDGVNDAMALKKADLGVAMFAGASATRRVADIVLMNNSFNSLPIGMKLGNKIMQSIEIIATLFFHKIIFGVVLLFSTMAMGLVYPFLPRHITFMNIFLVTLPTIMWTIFAPSPRHKLSPKYFWNDTLMAIAPIATLSGIAVTSTYAILSRLHPEDIKGIMTSTVIMATLFGINMVFLVPRMFDVKNTKKAKVARFFYVTAVALIVFPSFKFAFIRDFFDFTMPAWTSTWPLVVLLIGIVIFQWRIAISAGDRIKRREP